MPPKKRRREETRRVGAHDKYVQLGFSDARLEAAIERFPLNDNPTPDEFLDVLHREEGFFDGMVVDVQDDGPGPMPALLEDRVGECVVCFDNVRLCRAAGCICKEAAVCKSCMERQLAERSTCPTCRVHVRTPPQGPCPPARATVKRFPKSLKGYEGHGHFSIRFKVPSGRQQEGRDPNPGESYAGKYVFCYLPDTDVGVQLGTRMLNAFRRGHAFCVGTSLTTGETNVTTFNGVHMKTTLEVNTTYGYPDPTYLNRLEAELTARGF